MSWLMRLTHNSLATIIAWVSTCMLAGGVGTLFGETTRSMWMLWGCFGLAAALGLDVVARVRERIRIEQMSLVATNRFERDMNSALEENTTGAAIRAATARVLGRPLPATQAADARRSRERWPCDLDVELLFDQSPQGSGGQQVLCTQIARVTNLSEGGFELTAAESLSRQKMRMIIAAATGGRQTMLGEVLWCSPQPDGSFSAGGRFLDVGPFTSA